jgi:hypothetical protein
MDEIDVVVSFLQQNYCSRIPAGTPLVIEDTLSGWNYKSTLLPEASDKIPIDLIRDYCEKNKKAQAVWPELSSRLYIKLISLAELRSLFSAPIDQKPDGWDRFYVKFPKSPGFMTLSRVGFNQKKDKAMFYFSSRSWGMGSGRIHIFRKQDGKWIEEPYSIGTSWIL